VEEATRTEGIVRMEWELGLDSKDITKLWKDLEAWRQSIQS
jgi:hypothetical protein